MDQSLKICTIGRRKKSTAKLLLTRGSGNISINTRSLASYFSLNSNYITKIQTPLELLDLNAEYDLKIQVSGGGLSGQASSIQLALARALSILDKDYRKILKLETLLKCDARKKERKKYGLKKARKAPQFSKR